MIPYNHPDSPPPLNEKAVSAPPPEAVERLIGQVQRGENVDPADLRRVLGVIKGIEVGPNSVPNWTSEPTSEQK